MSPRLERDDFSSNRHPALSFCLSMIFPENRCPLFRIMLKLTLEFPDDFFGREFGFCLGRGIIRRHEAGCRLAPDESAGLSIRGYGRAPMSRPALVSHNRKLRYLSHIASKNRPRAPFGATDMRKIL
jgi:hypothetical protein